VQVEGVDEVELGQVREVDPDELALPDADRVLRVVEGAPVDGVEVVLAVPVGVVAVHDHDQLVRRGPRLGRVDDEGAVEALMDVLLERRRVAVVELHPVGARGELVREGAAGLDDLEDAVHLPRVDAVEVDRVRVRARVDEVDPQQVVLGHADDRPRHRPVVGPGRELDALRDLDRAVGGHELVLAHAAGLVGERGRWNERVVLVMRAARCRHVRADHRGVAEHRVVVAHVRREALAVGGARPGELGERGRGDERQPARDDLLAREFSHGETYF
jgi:hypothetical protein